MEKIIVTITVELDPSAPVTWGMLRRVIAGQTPANDRLAIRPEDGGQYPLKAKAFGIDGVCTVVAA